MLLNGMSWTQVDPMVGEERGQKTDTPYRQSLNVEFYWGKKREWRKGRGRVEEKRKRQREREENRQEKSFKGTRGKRDWKWEICTSIQTRTMGWPGYSPGTFCRMTGKASLILTEGILDSDSLSCIETASY